MKIRLLTLSALALALTVPSPAASASIPGPNPGQAAPPFRVKMLDGKTVTLANFKGKVLVLNFWATWCPPCRRETPDMIASYKKLGSPGVVFLGLDQGEEAPLIRAFIAAKSLPYPVALDSDRVVGRAYDIRGIPTTYVIDGNGIIRARWVDVIAPEQLTSFVASAKEGKNGVIASALQTSIDRELDPSLYPFGTGHDAVLAAVKLVQKAISDSNAVAGKEDLSTGQVVDYLKTRAAQAALRDDAIAALMPVAADNADKALLLGLQGDSATDEEHWAGAAESYAQALALDLKNQDALGGLAFAQYELHDWQDEIASYQKLMALAPDAGTYIDFIGRAGLQLKEYPNAIAATQTGLTLAEKALAADPKKSLDSIVLVAYAHLYLAKAYVAAGESGKAHNQFLETAKYAVMMPVKSSSFAMYNEEAQEGLLSLDLDRSGRTAVTLAPWTGADLPGSVPGTIKYRLTVSGTSGKLVHLRATGMAKGWIASFCSDRVCSPMQLALNIPSSGVKIIEFQMIHNDDTAPKTTPVKVQASDGTTKSSADAHAVFTK
ncbi:MAG: redoxin domain-containing protein [Candidatus Baltobacteraceae bacterium]